jgi:hypothetical protein
MAVQVPALPQVRVQHSAPAAQVAPVLLHCVAEHMPLLQRLLQHCVELLQLAPEPLQKLVALH